MTTPTGWIQTSDVNVEMGRAWNQAFSFNDPAVRALSQVPGDRAPISMANMRGRSNTFTATARGDYSTGTSSGTASAFCYPEAFPVGGSGNFSYQWTVLSGSGTISDATAKRPSVRQSIGKFGFIGSTMLRVVIRDNVSGWTVTIDNVSCDYEWYVEGQDPR